jgi:hypothetical protein
MSSSLSKTRPNGTRILYPKFFCVIYLFPASWMSAMRSRPPNALRFSTQPSGLDSLDGCCAVGVATASIRPALYPRATAQDASCATTSPQSWSRWRRSRRPQQGAGGPRKNPRHPPGGSRPRVDRDDAPPTRVRSRAGGVLGVVVIAPRSRGRGLETRQPGRSNPALADPESGEEPVA